MTRALSGPDYDARIRRARNLAVTHAFAKEVLTFYSGIAEFHSRLYSEIHQGSRQHTTLSMDSAVVFQTPLDVAALSSLFPGFISFLQRAGPQPISDAARRISRQDPAEWADHFNAYWSDATSHDRSKRDRAPEDSRASRLDDFILRAFLQPYAEFIASRCASPLPLTPPSVCPLCRSLPLLGVIRPEGDGGKRNLLCSLCLHEWSFRRILCPVCNEESESKLPVFIAEQFPHIRVEACDTCGFYIRSVDLTRDGNAVPLIDDLAAMPLTLWADEHNYSRCRSNLLGT